MLIGYDPDHRAVKIDLDRLIVTKMLVQANSGAGKSWTLRRLLEQTHGKVQQIVIDVEDEFYTLREKYDYVLAGRQGGDCPADVRSAALLARRLLELGVSAIVGIYELKARDRVQFVKLFLESLISSPRELWHPCLVVLDEAQTFAPEKGEGETDSTEAVVDFMSKCRKRAFCGILATQRISKLSKSAAAECNNKLIGRSALDTDMKRAARELGFAGREQELGLRELNDGEFYAFGPAISRTVTLVKVGPVETTHPKAGQQAAPPPPPKEKVRKVLSQLADLPKEAELERVGKAELEKQVRELKARLVQAETATYKQAVSEPLTPDAKKKEFDRGANSVKAVLARELKRYDLAASARLQLADKALHQAYKSLGEIETMIQTGIELYGKVDKPVMPSLDGVIETAKAEPVRSAVHAPPSPVRAQFAPPPRPVKTEDNGHQASASIGGLARKILTVLAQYPEGMGLDRLAILSTSTVNGHFNNTLGSLRSSGYVTAARITPIQITQEGLSALGSYDPMPTGEALRQYWLNRMGSGIGSKILRVLIENYPNPISLDGLAKASSGTLNGHFNNTVGSLRTMGLMTPARTPIRASEHLFEE
jgi:hypothetical protein